MSDDISAVPADPEAAQAAIREFPKHQSLARRYHAGDADVRSYFERLHIAAYPPEADEALPPTADTPAGARQRIEALRRDPEFVKRYTEGEGSTSRATLPAARARTSAAIEASLAENVARLPMDEIDQYKAFAALKQKGRSIADIANEFGVTELLVKKRLAIAELVPAVLTAYRKDKIDPDTLRLLTMATKEQQKAWLALLRDPEQYAPTGHRLKAWLFGGAEIPVDGRT